MKLITQSRLFGILLVAASLPMDPGVALAASAASAALEPAAPPGSVEARLQRIAAAVREGQEQREADQQPGLVGDDAISYVVVGPGGIGWNNGGWGNGGFANGGFYNGGFRNGGGAWRNGGGGSAWRNGGGGGFRNHW